MLTWTVSPDSAMLDQAVTDLRRALILQNARTAKRLDPVSKLRTHRNETRLRRFGLVLCALGLVLASLLFAGSYALHGSVRPLHAVLLGLFVVLLPVFVLLPRLRRAGIRRVDAMLARRASKVLAAWPEGVTREYTICEGLLSTSVEGEPGLERAMQGLEYGLVGEATLMLFASPRKQTPALIVLVGSEGERVAECLSIAKLERLSRGLLPASTVERSW